MASNVNTINVCCIKLTVRTTAITFGGWLRAWSRWLSPTRTLTPTGSGEVSSFALACNIFLACFLRPSSAPWRSDGALAPCSQMAQTMFPVARPPQGATS